MKIFGFILLSILISGTALAANCQFTGSVSCPDQKQLTLPPPPAPVSHRRYSLNNPTKLSAGIELGAGAFPSVPLVGNISGLGILGDYNIDPQLSIEGRMMFSGYNVSTPVYYYGGYGYYGHEYNTNFNQVDLTIGPNYRFLRGALSPVAGVMLGYAHRYYNSPYYYNYSYAGGSDSAEVGGLVALDYRINSSVSAGLDLRYMMPFASSNSSGVEFYPGTTQPVENLNYYVGGVYLKFSF